MVYPGDKGVFVQRVVSPFIGLFCQTVFSPFKTLQSSKLERFWKVWQFYGKCTVHKRVNKLLILKYLNVIAAFFSYAHMSNFNPWASSVHGSSPFSIMQLTSQLPIDMYSFVMHGWFYTNLPALSLWPCAHIHFILCASFSQCGTTSGVSWFGRFAWFDL